MPSAHKALIMLATKLGYTKREDGICHGFTLKCLEAYLLDEQTQFINRVNDITKIAHLDLWILAAQEKIKRRKMLTPMEYNVLQIPPFYDGVFLYQEPNKYFDIFNQYISQIHLELSTQLACSEAIQAKKGLFLFYSESNSYTRPELRSYLHNVQKFLSEAAMNAQCNLGVLLSSENHTVGLFYQYKRQIWTFMDINQWPPFEWMFNPYLRKSSEELLDKIWLGFSAKNYTTFSANVVTTYAEHMKLGRLTSKMNHLSKLHPISRMIFRDNKHQEDLFLSAIQHGNVQIIISLMRMGLNPNQMVFDEGFGLLHLAVHHRQLSAIRILLLKAKLSPNQKTTPEGITPLFMAARRGYVEIAKILLSVGANPNLARIIDGVTPLYMATVYGHVAMVKLLLSNARTKVDLPTFNAGVTPLFIAVQNGQCAIVKNLLDAGADFNHATRDNGATPLIIAAQMGHVNIVELLLDKGVNPNQEIANNGTTALLVAAQEGHLSVVKLLLKRGADPNRATVYYGETPLFVAAYGDHYSVVQTLLMNPQTNPNQSRQDNGASPLFIAAKMGSVSMVKLLLAAGADPNQATKDGSIPLYIAVLLGHFDVACALLHHFDVVINHLSLIPAIKRGYAELVNVMLRDETIRDYYLKHILLKPGLMRDQLINNKIFLKALLPYRNEFWIKCKYRQEKFFPEHEKVSDKPYGWHLKARCHAGFSHPLSFLFTESTRVGNGIVSIYPSQDVTSLDKLDRIASPNLSRR